MKIFNIIFISMTLCIFAGCTSVDKKPTEPEIIQTFFFEHNGSIPKNSLKGLTVIANPNFTYLDNKTFGIVISPRTWSSADYDIFIFAGEKKITTATEISNFFTIDKEMITNKFKSTDEISSYFSDNRIGFAGFYLGAKYHEHPNLKGENNTILSAIPENSMLFVTGKIGNCFYQLEYYGEVLVWMHFRYISINNQTLIDKIKDSHTQLTRGI